MSDGSLSQDEIDALLQGSGGFDLGDTGTAGDDVPQPTTPDTGAIQQFLAGLVDSQTGSLSGLIGKDVTFGQPVVEVISNGGFVASLPDQIVQIVLSFTGGASGAHSFIFSPEIATMIAGLMMGQEEVELNDAALSALVEAGNTITGSEATTISSQLGLDVATEPGESRSVANNDVEVPPGEFVKATYQVTIEGEQDAELIEIFDLGMLQQIAGGGAAPEPAAPIAASPTDMLGDVGFGVGDQDAFAAQPAQGQMSFGMSGQPNPNVQSVQFPALGGATAPGDQGNIGLLMDVYMEMTVELGRTRKLIRDILGMGEGTIIELDKLAGEPVDILVNHKLIAKGEVVVIEENFGVRVTEIVDPMDRVPDM
ncbi:MAG: flagellar motor switch protein FliN [Spirochaetales bacterium]|nr:flagellar motor switch protein FliN [Spirochaetales bacterium]